MFRVIPLNTALRYPNRRRMVASFAKAAGWNVEDLGNDVEAVEFVDTAEKLEARIIGISAMMNSTAENIIKVREEIDKRNLTGKVMLAVGGAVFKLRPTLVKEIGADGTSPDAMQAPKLFETLIQSCDEP